MLLNLEVSAINLENWQVFCPKQEKSVSISTVHSTSIKTPGFLCLKLYSDSLDPNQNHFLPPTFLLLIASIVDSHFTLQKTVMLITPPRVITTAQKFSDCNELPPPLKVVPDKFDASLSQHKRQLVKNFDSLINMIVFFPYLMDIFLFWAHYIFHIHELLLLSTIFASFDDNNAKRPRLRYQKSVTYDKAPFISSIEVHLIRTVIQQIQLHVTSLTFLMPIVKHCCSSSIKQFQMQFSTMKNHTIGVSIG